MSNSFVLIAFLLTSSSHAYRDWQKRVVIARDCPMFGGVVANSTDYDYEGELECYCRDYSVRLEAALSRFTPDYKDYCFESEGGYVCVAFENMLNFNFV